MSTARAADKTWDFTNDPSGELTIAGNNDQPWQNTGGNPGGFLALTYPQNSQYAAIVFPNLDPGKIVTGFTLSADLRVGNPTGDRAADGFSVSFARDGDPILADPGSDSGFAGRCCAETGTRTGIAVSFDTWSGNTFPNDPADTTDIEGVIVRLDDVTVKKVGLPTRNGACDDLTSLQTGPRDASFWAAGGDTRSAAAWKTLCWKTLAVNLTTDGKLTVSWKGNILLDGFQTTYFPTAGQLVLAARTGGANEHTHFDNLKLTTIAQTITAVPGAPSNLKAAEAGANRVLLTWDKAVVAGDPNAKVAYDILRDGNVIASTVTSLSFEDRGVNSGRSYTYIVRGKNIAGTAGPDATLSVKTAGLVDTLGFLQAKVWYGIGGTAVDALLSDPHYQDPPDSTRYVNGFSFGETSNFGNTYGDNFGVVIQGSFTAPETGSYRFFVRSDDASQLFINTAGGTAPDPTASTPIANEDGCCKGFLEDAPYASEPIALTAGKQYGLTFVVKEGGGGDWGQVAVRKEGDSTPAGNLSPIRGAILAGKGDAVGASVSITKQPANLTVTANGPAEMSAEATGTSPYGADYGKVVAYQWYVNNAPVLGANGPVFSVNVTPKSYNGAKVKVVASVAGASVTSSEAILTVNDDKVAPTVKRVSGSDTFDSVTVIFSEPVVDPSALDASKYKITGLTLSAGTRVNDRTVKFTTSKQAVGTKYDVTVNGVLDLASNPSAYTGSFVTYKFQPGVVQFNLWLNEGGGFDTFDKNKAPTQVRLVDRYFTGAGLFENYFGQLKGMFTAPKTGDYVFWVASDDHGELYLSTDENPANKKKIAEEPVWSDPQYWKTDGGANSGSRGEAGALANRSDEYQGTEWATGAGGKVTLTAGKKYYLEVLYKEGGGGDHGAATFSYLGDAVPANGQTALKGDVVGWFIDPQTSPPIITKGLTTQKYARGETLRFQLGVDSALPVTVTWYKNYKRIDGATGTTLEIPNAGPQHIGDYHAVVSNENGSVATDDGNNNGSRAIMTGAFVIESEDYNHSRGKSVDLASLMPLADSLFGGLDGIPGFDINFANSTDDPCANGNSYRNGWNDNGTCVIFPVGAGGNLDVIVDNGPNQDRPDYVAANNYKIGWMPQGAWFNYTRNIPPGTYNAVFVGSRDGRDVDANTVALEIVADPTVENAPGTEVARVTFNSTGGWSSLDQIPFTNPDGTPTTFTVGGKTTIRVRNISGGTDHDYLLLYRTVDPSLWLGQGLRAHYPLNGQPNDASGNAHHGTAFGVTPTADRFGNPGKAVALSSGASSYIALPEIDPEIGAPRGSFTISAWVKANNRSGANVILAATDSNPYQMPRLDVRQDRTIGYYHRVPTLNYEGGGTTKIGTDWNHIVYVSNGDTGQGRVFINGVEDPAFRYAFDRETDRRNANRVWALGTVLNTTCGGCNPYFEGSLDDVRIYNRALSDLQVSDLNAFEKIPPSLSISSNPNDKSLPAGDSLVLTARFFGMGLTYRWQRDGVDLADNDRISGASTDTLRIAGLVPGDAGRYRLVASNTEDSLGTAEAHVVVLVPPAIVEQPGSIEGLEDENITLRVVVTGSPTPSFQWMKDEVAIPGATSDTLVLAGFRASDAGSYRVRATSSAGTVLSEPAVVTFVDGVRFLIDGSFAKGIHRTVDPVTVDLQFARGDWLLFYTLDGSEPNFVSNPYAGPFLILQAADVRVIAYSPDFSESRIFDPFLVRFLQPQSLEWAALPDLRYQGSGVVDVQATSGFPVALSLVSGPATLTGNRLVATGVGPVVIRASQAGSDAVAPIIEEKTLNVGKALQTLVWPVLVDRTFGESSFPVVVTAKSGLPVTLSVDSGKATVTAGAVMLTGAGLVTLKATQAGDALHEPVMETRVFQVAKADQTLTFASIANRPFSPEVFTPIAVASSKLPVTFEVVSGPAEVAGTGLKPTGVGSVVVRARQEGNDDFLPSLPVDRTFSITLGSQTLTFTAVGAKKVGDGPVTLKATSNRDLPVTFRVLSGPGTIEGDVLTLTGAGSIVVQAIQTGNEFYAAGSASQTIVVAKAVQSVAFATIPDRGYTPSPIALSATASSGLPVSFRLVSGLATISGSELRLTGVGAVAVAADQVGNSNYLAAPSITNRFTITRGVQEITFGPIGDQILGGAPLALDATSSAGLPVVFQIISGSASVSGNQLNLLGAGSITVRARQVGSPLWLPAQVDQTFVASKSTPTISFVPVGERRFGDKPITLQASSSSGGTVGFRVITGPATVQGSTLTLNGAGDVVVEAFQTATALNEAASIRQTIPVSKGVQSLSFNTLTDVSYSKTPVPLTASSQSGLPVVIRVVQGPVRVEGNALLLSGVGDVVVEATQDGDANWLPAEPVTRSFRVIKATQTLSFAALSDRPFSADAVALVASVTSGLPVQFEIVSGPATITGSKLTLTGVGRVVVRALQPGDDFHEAAPPQDRGFAVSKATQVLTFAPIGSKAFGTAPVTLSATSSAGLQIQFRVLSGPGAIDGNRLTLVGAGEIGIEAFQPGDDIHAAATARQTVVVTRASQILSFPPIGGRGYSTNPIPLLAESTSGLPVSFRLVGGLATLSGTELRLTGIGTIAVAVDQPGNTNYAPAPSLTNTFVVGRGVQEITFAPVGDQLLGSTPVALKATSSAGLSVAFVVLSGPATLSGSQLTLLNEGGVTIRAFNPGSPLWLPAQVEQAFQIRKLATLAVTIAGQGGGKVVVSPLKERYEPAETVTLTAEPADGFAFDGWTGDLSGNANPATILMSLNRSVSARFKDIWKPVLSWDLPAAGTTGDERISISGRVADNAGTTELVWSREGGVLMALPVASDGTFFLKDVVLNPGENNFRLVAKDAAGNETIEERVVVWAPDRVLEVIDAPDVQEGQRVLFPLTLSSTGSDIAGLTFRLGYDPAYLTDPRVEWGGSVGQSVNNVNTSVPGEIAGSFALAGTGLPAGTNLIATVSFRARSVPWSTNVSVNPEIVSIGTPTGSVLNFGNATLPGRVSIVPRKIRGDNNANQRLDIGDATVISRLQVGLEQVRPWDLALNDLNGNKSIDTGDIIKVLRVVVGLDPQPESAPRVGPQDLSSQLLRSAGLNTNDVATLEFPDGPVAQPGRPYRVVVKLSRSEAVISGMSFTVNHPLALTLIDKQLGNLVPSDALPLWADAPGSVQLAALRSTPWPSSTGVAAVLTFLPTAEITSRASWPIEVVRAELAGAGFDVRTPVDVRAEILGIPSPTATPKMVLSQSTTGEDLLLDIEADSQTTLVLETTTDLMNWTEDRRLNGQGLGSKIRLRMTRDEKSRTQFWRIRVP